MADRRRRRGSLENENNDSNPVVRKSECSKMEIIFIVNFWKFSEYSMESEHGDEEQAELSEYESADEEKQGKEEETESEEETETETESEEEDDDDDDGQEIDVVIEDDEWVDEERQSGDGEEQPDSRDVDDDEDRKNPAFVPRKGAFYEHDLRLGDAKPPKEEDGERPKKKLWKDDGKWLHDGYNEALQGPKSTEELVDIYGYDVRAGSHPPEYRPRPRRGGTGRGRRQNHKLGDFVPSERSGGNSDRDYQRSKSEETEYIPMEYRSPQSYRATDTNDSRPSKSQSYNNNRHRDRTYNDNNQDNRYKGDNYQSDYSNKRDNSFSHRNKGDNSYRKSDNYIDYRNKGDNQGEYENRDNTSNYRKKDNNYQSDHKNRGNDYQSNYRNKGDNYQSNYDKSQDFRNAPNNQGQYNNYNDQGDYHDNYRGRGRRGRGVGRGRGQRRHDQEENNSGSVNVPRQFTNSSYKSPENGDQTHFEANDGADINISNKENVQTISVTITNKTTEKAYESETRRMKYVGGKPYIQEEIRNAVEKENMAVISPPITSNSSAEMEKSGQVVNKAGKIHQSTGGSIKADNSLQGRPKRYSSQRQRTVPDNTYNKQQVADSSAYYNQASAYPNNQYYPGDSQSTTSGPDSPAGYQHQQQPILPVQPSIPYPHPVSSAPRMYSPAPPAIATPVITPNVSLPTPHPTMIPPPNYLGQGPVIYGAAPPGINPPPAFPVPLGYTGPNPPQQIQSPPSQQPEVYRGGTIYYPPELQQTNPHRSPVRRTKSAIPIVKPQEKKDGAGTQSEVEYIRDDEQSVSDDVPLPVEDTEVFKKELSEISSALISLEGELRAGSTKVRQKEEDLKNLDLQKKLDSYLQSEESTVNVPKEHLKSGASQTIEDINLNSQTEGESFNVAQKGDALDLGSIKTEIDAIKTESVQSVSGSNTDQTEKNTLKDLPSEISDAKHIVNDNSPSDTTVKESVGNVSSPLASEYGGLVDTKSDIETKTETSTDKSSPIDN
ncbi:hypothetical protein LOTGIDRAFT_237809 [Lottia gigantea]|uniref:Protein CASC3 n=1 Tax=Lottia gigantea TaxID=225164 RepID=V4AZM9_LOTGI|nr:hypothetical protein LOTGIDRAFT_237809 [Lottia gigantea]ESP03198.1 hypothetical protein LOTGIDRAFT_237809 [Lottia gigantea]